MFALILYKSLSFVYINILERSVPENPKMSGMFLFPFAFHEPDKENITQSGKSEVSNIFFLCLTLYNNHEGKSLPDKQEREKTCDMSEEM